jgi:hypothetical protein
MGVLGSKTSRNTPTDIVVVPRTFDPARESGVKKTSTVLVSRPLGTDVLLGLLIKSGQKVQSFRLITDAGPLPPPVEVTKRDEWRGTLRALRRFMAPGRRKQWVLFTLPSITDFSFTSELTVSHPPAPPRQQDVPFVALHAQAGDDERRVYARIRMGLYGFGVSVVRAPRDQWKAT